MGKHSDLRVAQEKKIAQLKDDLATNEGKTTGEARQAAECVERAAKLAPDAASGNQKALSEQVKLMDQKSKHQQQIQNLEGVAAPLRRELAAAEKELAQMVIDEHVETVLGKFECFPSLLKTLSEALAVPVAEFGAFGTDIAALCKDALPVLGDRDRVARLEKALQQSLHQAIRVELNRQFGAHGIHIFATRFEEKDFASVMGPPLQHLRQALEMKLHTNAGIPIAGRAMFLARDNIAGLFGLTIVAGERMSLPVDDPNVRAMVKRGALEQIADERAVSA
jgi:hypothetical protein